jgi:hypothetical protein
MPVAAPGPVEEAAEEPVEEAAEEPVEEPVEEAFVDPFDPAPAAGRSGSVTSMYSAPADPGSARTAAAADHFAARRLVSPK